MEEVQQFLEAAVRGSCEGLMVKALGGPGARYDIARRSHNWLKVPPPPHRLYRSSTARPAQQSRALLLHHRGGILKRTVAPSRFSTAEMT